MRKLIHSVLKRGKKISQVETTIVCKDGSQKIVRFDIGPIKLGKKIAGAVGTAEDVTVTKRAEEVIRRSEQELRLLSSRLLDLQDAERRRIARELHDVTAQNLFAIHLALTRLMSEATGDSESILKECLGLCEQSRDEIRTLSYLLHPPMLDEAGLVAALKWYSEGFSTRTGITVRLETDRKINRLPIDIETDLFRVVQECLANVHRHSGSNTAVVQLRKEDEGIILRVQDSGHGMPTHLSQGRNLASLGVGIAGMRERLAQYSGRLEIKSGPRGTRITAVVPHARATIEKVKVP
jgi:signal transduction histidine kinase